MLATRVSCQGKGILHAVREWSVIIFLLTNRETITVPVTNFEKSICSMNPERQTIPDWEQQLDLEWLAENLDVFQSAVAEVFDKYGRGALTADLTESLVSGGNPFTYWPQSYLEEYVSEAVNLLVQNYDPESELVVILLKPNNHMSTYRICTVQPS